MYASLPHFFSILTVDALATWAGEAVFQRGRAYHKASKVRNIALAPDGGLVATVDGTRKYATLLFQEKEGELASLCTCPYGPRCKHAVAVACAGLALPDGATPIPLADADDKRLLDLEIAASPDEASPAEHGFSLQELEVTLKTFSKERLIALVMQAVGFAPEMASLCLGKTELQQKDALTLVKDVRRAMRNALEEPDWDRHGYLPDYDPVRKKLEVLRLAGLPAEVLDLGLELLEDSVDQIAMYQHDDWKLHCVSSNKIGIAFCACGRRTLSTAHRWISSTNAVTAPKNSVPGLFCAPCSWSFLLKENFPGGRTPGRAGPPPRRGRTKKSCTEKQENVAS